MRNTRWVRRGPSAYAAALVCLALGALLSACGGRDDKTSAAEERLAPASVPYKGVSLAGAEFGVDPYGNGAVPGTFGVDYIYPDPAYAPGYGSADDFLSKGMTTFRLPFRWERLQPTLFAPFDAAELGRLTTTVSDLTAKGATVLLDPHNYARYGTSVIGSAAVPSGDFADFWSRLAAVFAGNPKVVFGLMNEPHDMPTEQWSSAANVAIAAIRQAGATNLILVPGNGWTGGGGWASSGYGTPNASVMLSIQDPGNNFAFEVHQYFDADASGTSPTCVSTTVGSESLAGFTSWLRQNGKRGFLGEFGASSDPTCLAAIDDIVSHVEANADIYLGWTYWAAGPWWGTNWMVLEPVGGADVPQMTTLLPHLAPAAPPPPACRPASYDAATMTASVGGATAGGWNLWSNGYLSTNHTVTAGQSTLTVTAYGSVAAGVWPHMIVSVDGAPIGDTFVSATSWADYAFPFTAAAGTTHEVRVTFDNDYCSTTEDRNLYVAKLVVGCGTGAPPPPAPTCSDGIQNGNETGVDCGGSCPACPAPACQPATFAAGSMTASVGAATQDGWNLWSDGYLSTNATFAAGAATLTVNAEGSIAAGVWPHMVVSVGGVVIGSASVQSATWTSYPFAFTATAGTQEIRVTYDNDYCSTTEDRNLYVQSVSLSCGSQATCVPTTCAAGGMTCGSAPDGCGGTLQCGTCAAPQTCGGGGVANVCGTSSGGAPPPPLTTHHIMPLGDSITLGVNGGYRDGLYTRLTAAGKSFHFVGSQYDPYTLVPEKYHEGHPGFTIGNIAASAEGWFQSATPDYVLLMIGTNDVAWWCAQTGSQVADQNAALIDQIVAALPGAWVVVASIPPLSSSIIQPNNVDRAQLGVDYNAALVQRVQARIAAGQHVRFADVYAVLSVSDLYDGVHPTQAAADKVAQVWFDALSPILP